MSGVHFIRSLGPVPYLLAIGVRYFADNWQGRYLVNTNLYHERITYLSVGKVRLAPESCDHIG